MKLLRSRLWLLAFVSAFQLFSLSAFGSDLSITAASVVTSGGPTCKYATGPIASGVTVTAGQAVYWDGTVNGWKLANASSATAYGVAGIALNGGGAGQNIRVVTKDPQLTLTAALFTIGDTVWLSANNGGLTKTATEGVASANYVTVMGVAVSTSQINLNITSAGAVRP